MAITHIVLFQFKPEVDDKAVSEICQQMLDLKQKCLHPDTKKPYIKSSVGGVDHSPEGAQEGTTHAFVVELDNEEDRTYYLKADQAHQDFMKAAGSVLKKVIVVDFTPGKF